MARPGNAFLIVKEELMPSKSQETGKSTLKFKQQAEASILTSPNNIIFTSTELIPQQCHWKKKINVQTMTAVDVD
ncbi:hypothetical protein ACTXT7_007169 [Hymenolepis weldensis]